MEEYYFNFRTKVTKCLYDQGMLDMMEKEKFSPEQIIFPDHLIDNQEVEVGALQVMEKFIEFLVERQKWKNKDLNQNI